MGLLGDLQSKPQLPFPLPRTNQPTLPSAYVGLLILYILFEIQHGFEPRYFSIIIGRTGGTRTHNLGIKSSLLLPIELRSVGEPPGSRTLPFQVKSLICTTTSTTHYVFIHNGLLDRNPLC